MGNYEALAQAIIKYQESIIGPLALNEAAKVAGISINGQDVKINGDGKKILELLVHQYEQLFGKASLEACKDAVRPLLSKMGEDVDLPVNLL